MSTPNIPKLVLGTMARAEQADQRRVDLFLRAWELGYRAFDTAPLYGFGQADRQLGRALAQLPRDQVLVLSKVGLRWDAGEQGPVQFTHATTAGERMVVRRNSRPAAIVEEVSRSLERLGTDYLDLLQVHQPDPTTPIDETMGALADLQKQGLVRGIGVSNFSLEQIRQAHRALPSPGLAAVQMEYSLVRRGIERALLPWCASAGIAVLGYSPLAGGLLTGRHVADHPAIEQVVGDVLVPMARRLGVAPAALAIAWLLAAPGLGSVITGASTVEQLGQQFQAMNLALPEADFRHLADAFAGVQIVQPWEQSRLARLLTRLKKTLGG